MRAYGTEKREKREPQCIMDINEESKRAKNNLFIRVKMDYRKGVINFTSYARRLEVTLLHISPLYSYL
jgi:hypothetical protein